MDPAALYERIQRRLDLDGLSLVAERELGQMCEEAYFDLWDFLIGALGNEAPWERDNISTVAGQDFVDVTLAIGAYRILRLEFLETAQIYLPVSRLNLNSDAIDVRPTSWQSRDSFRYFARRSLRATGAARTGLVGSYSAWKFYFSPPPDAIHVLRLYSVPPPPITLDAEGDDYTLFPDDYPEYVVADVCAQVATKEQEDATPYEMARERIKARIERHAVPTQMDMPRTIVDLRSLENGSLGGGFMERGMP